MGAGTHTHTHIVKICNNFAGCVAARKLLRSGLSSRKLQNTHTLAREYLSDGARSQVELLSLNRDESLLCPPFFSQFFLPRARQLYPLDTSNFAGSWTSVNDHK